MQDAERRLLTLLMPEGLLEYFDIMEVIHVNNELHIHLDEKNIWIKMNSWGVNQLRLIFYIGLISTHSLTQIAYAMNDKLFLSQLAVVQ